MNKSISDVLEEMDELLDTATSVPLSGGKKMIDADRFRELVDDIRLFMPNEIKQAKAVVSDRAEIISQAKREADEIVKKAEARARSLVDNNEIVKQAQDKANEVLNVANIQSKEIRRVATEFIEDLMNETEECLAASLNNIKKTKAAFRSKTK